MGEEDTFEVIETMSTKEPQQLILYESAQIMELRREIAALRTKVNSVFWTNMVFRAVNLLINPVEIAKGHVKDALFYTLSKAVGYL